MWVIIRSLLTLATIHEGSEEEQDEMREWARYLGDKKECEP